MAKTNIPNAWNRLDVLFYLDQLYNKKKMSNMYKAIAIHLICTKETMNSMCFFENIHKRCPQNDYS